MLPYSSLSQVTFLHNSVSSTLTITGALICFISSPFLYTKLSVRISSIGGYIRLREVGAKRRLNGTSKVNRRTDTQTDSIGPEGRCFENMQLSLSPPATAPATELSSPYIAFVLSVQRYNGTTIYMTRNAFLHTFSKHLVSPIVMSN